MTQLEFDFDRSVRSAWNRFTIRLTEVLSMMDDTEPLTLVPYENSPGQWYVRFECRSKDSITIQVPTAWAGKPLAESSVELLSQLGFVRSGDVFLRSGNPHEYETVARISVRTLTQVFMVEHPIFLGSDVLAEVLQEGESAQVEDVLDVFDELAVYMTGDAVELAAHVEAELVGSFGSALMKDEDGDFAARIGSAMLFVRVSPDGQEVRLFSVVVHDVAGRSRAAEVLNDVNTNSRWVRFYLTRDRIIATLSLFVRPFVPAHLRWAIEEMTKIVDGVDDLLASSLQGRTTFSD